MAEIMKLEIELEVNSDRIAGPALCNVWDEDGYTSNDPYETPTPVKVVEIVSYSMGGHILDRDALVTAFGKSSVESQEQWLSERLTDGHIHSLVAAE